MRSPSTPPATGLGGARHDVLHGASPCGGNGEHASDPHASTCMHGDRATSTAISPACMQAAAVPPTCHPTPVSAPASDAPPLRRHGDDLERSRRNVPACSCARRQAESVTREEGGMAARAAQSESRPAAPINATKVPTASSTTRYAGSAWNSSWESLSTCRSAHTPAVAATQATQSRGREDSVCCCALHRCRRVVVGRDQQQHETESSS